MTESGSSASWITTWVISNWKKGLCSPSKTPSGQKCYLCLRNNLLPMCPVRTEIKWLRGKDLNLRPLGYEPNELPDCSTPHNHTIVRFFVASNSAAALA